jgi:D-alanyl-D-alanine endopeptidase (penicillin-binding protein 7)
MKKTIITTIVSALFLFPSIADAHKTRHTHKHKIVVSKKPTKSANKKQQSKTVRLTTYPEPSLLVMDSESRVVEVAENVTVTRPMASITKLMTAMIAIDHYSLSETVVDGKSSMSVESLLNRLLVRSDNHAAEVLARNYPGGREVFIRRMNERANSLGLTITKFDDPSGLSAGNVTTAAELATMVIAASGYPTIRHISSQAVAEFPVVTRVRKKSKTETVTKTATLNNTNHRILFEFNNVTLSKTGTTNAAGKCLALTVDRDGRNYVIIILGEPTSQARERTARQLITATISKRGKSNGKNHDREFYS